MRRFGLTDDIRGAARRVRREPRLSLLATGTLALGIAGATAVFTTAHTFLLAPPPYRDPDRIVSVYGAQGDRGYLGVSGPDMADFRAEVGLFEAATLTQYAEFSWTGQSAPGFDGAEVLRGLTVTAEYFRVFDQPLALGRGFATGEDRSGRNQVVVIAHSLWQRRFGERPDVLGQSLILNGEPHTVIGVTGPEFLPYSNYEVLVWKPAEPNSTRDSRQYAWCARLAAGVGFAQAQQRVDLVSHRLASAWPATNRDYRVTLDSLLGQMRRQARPALALLIAAVSCLLLIGAANAAALLLGRALARSREFAIRAALGAGRLRLGRMILAESLLLSLCAGAVGALLAVWILEILGALVPASLRARWIFVPDSRVFVAAFLLASLTGVLASLPPAFESFRLGAGGMRSFSGSSRLLRAVVTVEIALAVLLSVGAGLLGKGFVGLLNRPLGYRTDQMLGLRVRLTGDRYNGTEAKSVYWSQLIERAGSVPGVAIAAAVSDLPMGQQYRGGGFEVAGHARRPGEPAPSAHQISASPGYFAALGIAVLAGRGFTADDAPRSEPVAIVNDLLAQSYWPGQDAIGQRIRVGGVWRRVVGVTGRIRHAGPRDRHENEIYVPYGQINFGTMFLVLRTHVSPGSVIPAIRGVLHSLDPAVPAFEIRSLGEALGREVAIPRLSVLLTSMFALTAALLAFCGLFGVVAYAVARRTREFGIRCALGARSSQIRALVLRQGGRMAGLGLAFGLLASLLLMRLLRSQLYGVSEVDPWVYGGAAALAIVSTMLACWLPAARAARVDPAITLRQDE